MNLIHRTYWSCPTLDDPKTDAEGGSFEERFGATRYREETNEEDANLIGSKLAGSDTLHAPVLDLDFPARLVPSTTPGHSHLYLDVSMTWADYRCLLDLLGRIGILEQGYVSASIRRGQTFVRKPGVLKPPDAPKS